MMMKRRISDEYVCPVCFRNPENCICKCYSMTLILIDKNIQYAIKTLNDNGFVTVDCCEGHYGEKSPTSLAHSIIALYKYRREILLSV